MSTSRGKSSDAQPRDESGFSEIILLPDGRVYVHGTTRPLLEVLAELHPGDPRLAPILGAIHPTEEETGPGG